MKNLFTMQYTGGGGDEYDGGVWSLKETPKMMVFTLEEKPFYDINYDKLVIYKEKERNHRHCFRDWEDGTYTIYPDQCGTPYYFTPSPTNIN